MLKLADEELLAFLRLPALGDINDGCQNRVAALPRDRIQTDLDGELGSVFATTAEIPPTAHGTGFGLAVERRPVIAMGILHACRNQLVYTQTDELIASIAKQPLGARVDELDLALFIDDHDSVGRRVHEKPDVLVLSQHPLHALVEQ